MVWAASGFKFIDTHLLETVGLEKTFVIWGAIVLVMIVFGATLMKDAPKQEVKTSNGVVEKDYTWQSRCVNRSTGC